MGQTWLVVGETDRYVVVDGVVGEDKESGRLRVDMKEEFFGEEKDSNGTESSGGLEKDLEEDS